jgi:hypothetical protein
MPLSDTPPPELALPTVTPVVKPVNIVEPTPPTTIPPATPAIVPAAAPVAAPEPLTIQPRARFKAKVKAPPPAGAEKNPWAPKNLPDKIINPFADEAE